MSVLLENTPPGVTAIVNAGQVSRPLNRQPSSTGFLAGYAPWGPANTPITISSWSDYVRKFGGWNANSNLDAAVKAYFDLFGGRQLIISRAVGSSAAVASKTLVDRAGTPLDTLEVEAKYPSSTIDVSVQVANGTTANTVKLIFTSAALKITETFDDFVIGAEAIAKVNEQSKLVNLTDLASATSSPNNRPAVSAKAALTGGSDDFAGVNAAAIVAAIGAFADANLGGGQIAAPGYTDSTVIAALKAHAELYQRLAIIDSEFGDEVSDILAHDYSAARSSHVALYYPWVQMLDMAGSGVKKFYPPSIFALGACAQADRTVGVHKAPANYTVPGAVDVERNADGTPMFNDNARTQLNEKQINVIAPIGTEGIKIYGERLLHPTGETRVQFVHQRRVLNMLFYTLKLGLTWATFEVVGAKLFRALRSSAANFCRSMYNGGAFYGDTETEAFVVVCDGSNNPQEDLDQGIVKVQVAVKIAPTAERVVVNIDNVPLADDLNVLNGGAN
jgi:phage tail sheath protein FI